MNGQHIPPFFAMAMPAHGAMRRVWLFEAHRLNQDGSGSGRHESIRVRPSTRFARWYDEHPGFLMEDAEVSDWHERTTFVVDRPPRHGAATRYHGGYMLSPVDDWDRVREVHMRWRFAGATVYSMLCPDPIPLLNVEHPEYLPATVINEMRTVPCTRIIHRSWRQRWDPEYVAREIENLQAAVEEARHRRRHDRAPSPPRPVAGDGAATAPVVGSADPVPIPLPKFVADALIRDAVAAAATCPITMEPITAASAAVTSCFHVFDANAIAIWMVDHQTCPTCKTRAAV